jgi:hypothetical protein
MCPTARKSPSKAARSGPKHYRLVEVDGLTPMLRAVSVWLGVLAHCSVTQPGQVEAIPDDLELSDDQWEALSDHQPILGLVRASKPIVTISECAVCGRWSLVSTGPTTGKCKLTLGCAGVTTKARPAKKELIVPEADLTSEADPDADPELASDPEPDADAELASGLKTELASDAGPAAPDDTPVAQVHRSESELELEGLDNIDDLDWDEPDWLDED